MEIWQKQNTNQYWQKSISEYFKHLYLQTFHNIVEFKNNHNI